MTCPSSTTTEPGKKNKLAHSADGPAKKINIKKNILLHGYEHSDVQNGATRTCHGRPAVRVMAAPSPRLGGSEDTASLGLKGDHVAACIDENLLVNQESKYDAS